MHFTSSYTRLVVETDALLKTEDETLAEAIRIVNNAILASINMISVLFDVSLFITGLESRFFFNPWNVVGKMLNFMFKFSGCAFEISWYSTWRSSRSYIYRNFKSCFSFIYLWFKLISFWLIFIPSRCVSLSWSYVFRLTLSLSFELDQLAFLHLCFYVPILFQYSRWFSFFGHLKF